MGEQFQCPTRHITGRFANESFHAASIIGTDNVRMRATSLGMWWDRRD